MLHPKLLWRHDTIKGSIRQGISARQVAQNVTRQSERLSSPLSSGFINVKRNQFQVL